MTQYMGKPLRFFVLSALVTGLWSSVTLAQIPSDGSELPLPKGTKGEVRELKSDIRQLKSDVTDVKGANNDVKSSGDLQKNINDLNGLGKDVRVTETAEHYKIELSADILFDFDKATLRAAAETALTKIAALIQSSKTPEVKIEGYTDSKGADDYNLKLSERRATTVAVWLAKHKIDGGIISTIGKGEANPVAPNAKPDGSDDPAGRQKNRRVEIYLRKVKV